MKQDRDAASVSLDSDAALLYWTRYFDASPEELEEAVDIVGDSIDAVAAYLNIDRGPHGVKKP